MGIMTTTYSMGFIKQHFPFFFFLLHTMIKNNNSLILLLSILFITLIECNTLRFEFKKKRGLLKKRDYYRSRLYNHMNTEYLIEIGVGSPYIQNFTVALDTGSSELWIPSASCPAKECPLVRFESNQSSTYQSSPSSKFKIEYGIGSVLNGTFGRETLYLMDHQIKLENHLIGFASSTHDLILDQEDTANGIFGFGYPKQGKEEEHVIHRLVKEGVIQEPVFSIEMKEQEGWSGGVLTLGDHYSNVAQYEPLIKQEDHDYWMIGGKAVWIVDNDHVIKETKFRSVRGMIIDTGTTLSYMDHDLVFDLVQHIAKDKAIFDESSGTFLVDCKLKRQYGQDDRIDIVFQNGYRLRTSIQDLILPFFEKNEEGSICLFGIAPWISNSISKKMNENEWVLLGDSMLRSKQMIFDMKNHQIGFVN